MFTRVGLLVLLLVVVVLAGCGGGDDDGGSGGGGPASLQACLEDLDLDVRDNTLEPELKAAGATHQFLALDVNQQDYTYDVTVFSAADKASAYATKKQKEYDADPQFMFDIKAFGANAVTTTTDAPKLDDVHGCAEENG
jgi:hypothetical protein